MLHILSDKKRRAFYESQRGKHATVLFEEDIADGQMQGFTENYVRVSAQYDPLLINELKTVQLLDLDPNGLMQVAEVEALSLLHN
jgi:threonylcarbamoyladenosine tRNA methylthiotransferase MtaB